MDHLDAVTDEQTAAMLRLMSTGFPVVQDVGAPAAREAIAARRQPVPNLQDAQARDHLVERDDAPAPLSVRVYHPAGATSDDVLSQGRRPAVLFLHGGGFVMCDLETHDGFCRALSRHTGSVVASVDYRLAPEHPAPAAAEDAWTAYRWLLERADALGVDAERVAVAGDSAGGTLAAVLALMCRERGAPSPAAQALIYPVVDPALETASAETYAEGFYNTRASMRWYWEQYLADGWPDPPWLAAPTRASTLAGLPPAIVVTAGLDPLHDEGADYAEALRAAGVPVVHRDYPGLFHGFATLLGFAAGGSARALLFADLRAALDVVRVAA